MDISNLYPRNTSVGSADILSSNSGSPTAATKIKSKTKRFELMRNKFEEEISLFLKSENMLRQLIEEKISKQRDSDMLNARVLKEHEQITANQEKIRVTQESCRLLLQNCKETEETNKSLIEKERLETASLIQDFENKFDSIQNTINGK